MSYERHTDLIETVILENLAKGIQYRFTISEFNGQNYIGIREWYQDFEGEFAPSKNGVTLPYNLHTASRLYAALADILSSAEVIQQVIQESKNESSSTVHEEMQ